MRRPRRITSDDRTTWKLWWNVMKVDEQVYIARCLKLGERLDGMRPKYRRIYLRVQARVARRRQQRKEPLQ